MNLLPIHEKWTPDRVVINVLEAIPTNYEMDDEEFNERIIDMHISQSIADAAIYSVLSGE